MDFISWSVIGILFVLAESATGTLYLMSIGLACFYAAIADYMGLTANLQYGVLVAGILVHLAIVLILRKNKSSKSSDEAPTDVGQRVEVIEWVDETTARVSYQGKEWMAEKSFAEMPDATHGVIKKVQYGCLVIATEKV